MLKLELFFAQNRTRIHVIHVLFDCKVLSNAGFQIDQGGDIN